MLRNITFLLIILFSDSLFGQEINVEKKLEVNTEFKSDKKNVENAFISVESETDTIIFLADNAKFFLSFNKDYFVKFQKAGMETKIVKITTKNISIDRWNRGLSPISFSVELFPASENENFERLVACWRYSESNDNFVYETLYHDLKKDISRINDSSFIIEEIDYKNRVIIRGRLSSVEPEIKNGEFRFYSKNNELEAIGQYLSNLPFGIWTYYDKNGNIIKKIDYEKTLNFLMADTLKYSDTIPSIFIKKPKFLHENYNSFSSYIDSSIQYPIYPLKKNISDKVIISFITDETGSTRNLKILSSIGNLDLNMEALRLVSESPKWMPGEYNEKKIPVSVTYSIDFEKSKFKH